MDNKDFYDVSWDEMEKLAVALTEENNMEVKQTWIVLYAQPGCPMCQMLKRLLDKAKISYIVEEDLTALKYLNMIHVPVLVVDGQYLKYPEALRWVKEHDNSRQN